MYESETPARCPASSGASLGAMAPTRASTAAPPMTCSGVHARARQTTTDARKKIEHVFVFCFAPTPVRKTRMDKRERRQTLCGSLEKTGPHLLQSVKLLAFLHCRPQLLADGFVVRTRSPYDQAVLLVRLAPISNVRLLRVVPDVRVAPVLSLRRLALVRVRRQRLALARVRRLCAACCSRRALEDLRRL